MLNLKAEERRELISEIQLFFKNERGEDIGIIAADAVLDFFITQLGTKIYNQSLDDAKLWLTSKVEDIGIDYDMLYKN